MKNLNYKYWAFAIMILAFPSCTDFLDRDPLDEVTDVSYWRTEDDMKVYNNNLYTLAADCEKTGIMMAHGNKSTWISSQIFLDLMTDNAASINNRYIFYNNIKAGNRPIPTKPEYYDYQGWEFLRAINYGLANYDRAQIEQSIKNKYIAEAKLFRGWFYGVKVARYGDVQWTDKVLDTTSPELYSERMPRKQVMEKVLDDLTFACNNLPTDWKDGGAPGRLNRWAALLIKSRVCLFEGTFRKYHNIDGYESWLQEARDAAKEIIDKGPYKLYKTDKPVENEDYAFIYRQKDLTGNPQVLYWRRYSSGIVTHHAITYFADGAGASRSMVESYLKADGTPIDPDNYDDSTIEKVFENRDPRLRMSILHPEDKVKRCYFYNDKQPYPRLMGMTGGKVACTGYHVIKQYNNDIINPTVGQSEQAGVILQYAEVLLNYIEAKAELDRNSITQADIDITINELRDRAGMQNAHLELSNIPHDKRNAGDFLVDDLIYEIRRERRVEFFCDGFRYDDLMRWGWGKKLAEPVYGILWDDAAKERYKGADQVKSSIDPRNGKEYVDVFKGTSWDNPTFDPARDYLWPIPISVLSENNNITQNPGWDK